MELAVRATAEGLDVVRVRYPVGWSHVALQCHVVHVFVDVQEVANLTVHSSRLRRSQAFGERLQLHPCLVVAHLLVVLCVAQVELVHVLEVDAVVAVGEVLVVALADVEHAEVLAVEEDMGGLVVLTVHIEPAAQHHLLYGRVFRARIGVVAAIAHLPAAVFVVGLRGEHGVADFVHAFVAAVGLQAERAARRPVYVVHPAVAVGARPATAYLQVHLLVQHDGVVCFAIGICLWHKVFHVDGTLPVHVPVAGILLSVAADAVGAFHEDAYLIVEEVARLRHNGEHRQVVVVVAEDVAARCDGAGQVAVADEAEAQDGGLVYVEASDAARLTMCLRGSAAVGGVAQRVARGDADADGEGFAEEARGGVCRGCLEAELSEMAFIVGGARCSVARPFPFVAAVGGACPGASGNGGRVLNGSDDGPVRCLQLYLAPIGVQLEGNLLGGVRTIIALRTTMVEPQHLIAMGGDLSGRTEETAFILPLHKVHAAEGDVVVG